MKDKRRQETPKTPLSQEPTTARDWFNQHANKILIVLTLVILAVIFVRYRMSLARQRSLDAGIALAHARADLVKLEELGQSGSPLVEKIASFRDQLSSQIAADLEQVLSADSASDQPLRAEAYATRGDFYWALANFPVFPQAATRPALAAKQTPDVAMSDAQTDYQHVIDQYSDQPIARLTAQFGLAAIAENRGSWDEAKKWYEAIEKSTDIATAFQDQAKKRKEMLAQISQPIQIGSLIAPSTTQATTQSIITQISTLATTQPAATRPTTLP